MNSSKIVILGFFLFLSLGVGFKQICRPPPEKLFSIPKLTDIIMSYCSYELNNSNNKGKLTDNPLLANTDLPQFENIKVEHIEPAISYLVKQLQQDFIQLEKEIQQTVVDTNLYQLIFVQREKINYPLEYAWGIVSHLQTVNNSPELRQIYEQLLPSLIQQNSYMSQSKILYNGLKRLKSNPDPDFMTPTVQRILDYELQGMTLSGIDLSENKQQQFNQLKEQLSQLSSQFSNNLLDSIKKFSWIVTEKQDLEGLPGSAWELYSQQALEQYPESTSDKGPWKITLDIPSYLPIIQHVKSSKTREYLYRQFIIRGSTEGKDNLPIMKQILELKQQKATMLSFDSYAELSLSQKMAKNQTQVHQLLDQIFEQAYPIAINDLERLQKLARKELEDENYILQPWDTSYYAERLKEQQLDFKQENLKPYLSFEQVASGLFELAQSLFGIKIIEVDKLAERIQVWDSDVRYYRIFNQDQLNEPIASFYLDPFSRPANKNGGAWMNGCQDKSQVMGHLPIAYLICNGSPPIYEGEKLIRPSLMTLDEVETLFHEFGHGLQHMLTEVKQTAAAGINNIEWDAVELPSQFMENWCYHRSTLNKLAIHYQTQEVLPEDLYQKLIKQKTFLQAMGLCRQIYLSKLDLSLYASLDSCQDPIAIQHQLAQKYCITPMLPEDKFLCSFSHIFAGGYSAGYYSYKWAEVMSADAFGAFEEQDLNDAEKIKTLGQKFRSTILALGGSLDPAIVFRLFRGRDPDVTALIRHNLE